MGKKLKYLGKAAKWGGIGAAGLTVGASYALGNRMIKDGLNPKASDKEIDIYINKNQKRLKKSALKGAATGAAVTVAAVAAGQALKNKLKNKSYSEPPRPTRPKKPKGFVKAGAGIGGVVGATMAGMKGKGVGKMILAGTGGAMLGALAGKITSDRVKRARKENYKDRMDRYMYDKNYSFRDDLNKAKVKANEVDTKIIDTIDGKNKPPFMSRRKYRLGGALVGAGLAAGALALGKKNKKLGAAGQIALGGVAGAGIGKVLHGLDRKNREKVRY